MAREIVLVGLSHHTAPVEVREQLAFANGRFEPALRGLVALPPSDLMSPLRSMRKVEPLMLVPRTIVPGGTDVVSPVPALRGGPASSCVSACFTVTGVSPAGTKTRSKF